MRKSKTPWPTQKAMQQIYEQKLWGGYHTDFYSGDGSHNTEIVQPYIKEVKAFLKSFHKPPTVLDLGCGDFNIGQQLVDFSSKYIAVDIVPELIERNQIFFKSKKLEFQCLDIAKDQLPKADIVMLRQVLQHLSNEEIKQILQKLAEYKFIILTEHIPEENFVANKDIISGQGIRLKKNSGVDILKSPFNYKPKNYREILRISHQEYGGVLVSWVIESL